VGATERGAAAPLLCACATGKTNSAKSAALTFTIALGKQRHGVLVTREIGVLQHGPIREKLLPAISAFRNRVAMNVGKAAYDIRSHWDVSFEHSWVSTFSRVLIEIRRYGHGGACF
jgi:hypothetical protein